LLLLRESPYEEEWSSRLAVENLLQLFSKIRPCHYLECGRAEHAQFSRIEARVFQSDPICNVGSKKVFIYSEWIVVRQQNFFNCQVEATGRIQELPDDAFDM
jgi:hypothetical protein